jgi:predicted secreted protein
MTIVQFIVAYAICWWLVLFMVLPSGVQPESKPARGHAPSAPANPRLKRKFAITSVLALLPAALIYFVAVSAKAEDSIYHAGGGCEPLSAHKVSDDVAARDGYGVGAEKLVPATLESSTILGDMKSVDIPLRIPSTNYVDSSKYNADMSESFADMGTLEIGMDGQSKLNGRPINTGDAFSRECSNGKVEE